jgi:hypothetical protein
MKKLIEQLLTNMGIQAKVEDRGWDIEIVVILNGRPSVIDLVQEALGDIVIIDAFEDDEVALIYTDVVRCPA